MSPCSCSPPSSQVSCKTAELLLAVLRGPYGMPGIEPRLQHARQKPSPLCRRSSSDSGFLLAPAARNKPPAMLPRRGKYLLNDVTRQGQHFQVPLNVPKDFMSVIINKGSLSAMRFLTAINMKHPEMLEKVSRELWMRVWSRDEDITEPQSILAAAEKAGMSAEQARKLLEMISTAEVKNQLKETTKKACDYGAFGLPFTVAHVDGKTHMLFGSDRMELLAFLLGEKWMGPVPQAMNARL